MREAGLLSTDDRQGSNGGGIISEYQWYLILRKFGGAPHARFGMDFEILVGCQWIGCVDIFASVFLLCLDGLEECYFELSINYSIYYHKMIFMRYTTRSTRLNSK